MSSKINSLNLVILILQILRITAVPKKFSTTPSYCTNPIKQCPETKYRSYDGSCNNLKNPEWGSSGTPYLRLLPSTYADGHSLPTVTRSGKSLPNPRQLSLDLFTDIEVVDKQFTLVAMEFGNLVSFDMGFSESPQVSCCAPEGGFINFQVPKYCQPIPISPRDPFYGSLNVTCMDFKKSVTSHDVNCDRNKSAEQINAHNHYLDLSILYGNSNDKARQLRQFAMGKLKVSKSEAWPPVDNSGLCGKKNCYKTGDERTNLTPTLTSLYVIFLREHNRLAEELLKLNPSWKDEQIFQEARRINIAQYQRIVYYEFLLIFIGIANCIRKKISYEYSGFIGDYKDNVNPSTLNEHTAAAFRHFHSLIRGQLFLIHKYGNTSLPLSDHYYSSGFIQSDKNFDGFLKGMVTQPPSASDLYHTTEITQLCLKAGRKFGIDLKAVDIQRGRDHGLAFYNDGREFCGFKRANVFHDFADYMSLKNIDKLQKHYASPDDVQLTVGGTLETPLKGALAGPTFLCIMIKQFYNKRVGDRFFFENDKIDVGFTRDQLSAINNSTLAKLFCDNGNGIDSMQKYVMSAPSQENRIRPCKTLPVVSLSAWKDFYSEKDK